MTDDKLAMRRSNLSFVIRYLSYAVPLGYLLFAIRAVLIHGAVA